MLAAEQSQVDSGFEQLCRRLCNWGRWGDDDQLGTLNYITPKKVVEASAAVVGGEIVPLGIPLGRSGPQQRSGNPRRFDPFHFMTQLPTEAIRAGEVGASDDVLVLPLQAATQWDALAHMAHRGLLYGGRDAGLVTSAGAQTCGIQAVSGHVVSRAVLADVPRLLGVSALAPRQRIDGGLLADCLARQGVQLHSGDILLVRTGLMGQCRQDGWHGYYADAPGLDVGALEYLHQMEVAGVASDTPAVEVKPSTVDGQTLPFHIAALVYMGLLVGEIFDLDRLAARCAEDGRYDGLFVAPPLPIEGAVGSPINPYVIR